jgi:ABC-type transporter Mla MlaB component
VRIDGALTLATVGERWPELAAASRTASEIDLSGLTEFDSAGLACLTALKRERPSPEWVRRDPEQLAEAERTRKVPLKLRGASPKVLALASTYDVKALFDF